MEDSRNIIKAIDALTLKAGGEVVDSKNITEAIDHLKEVYSQEAIGIDKTLTQEGLAADAKAVGDAVIDIISKLPAFPSGRVVTTAKNGFIIEASDYRQSFLVLGAVNTSATAFFIISIDEGKEEPVLTNFGSLSLPTVTQNDKTLTIERQYYDWSTFIAISTRVFNIRNM